MGSAIPFAEIKRAKLFARAEPSMSADSEQATARAIRAAVNQSEVLAEARPLLD
jgi:hypothetical protein